MARRLDLPSAVSTFLQDIRFGARQFIRTPSFTIAAVLTLAVGIGATTTVFSFVNAIVLQPLAYEDSDRLVLLVPTVQFNDGPRTFTASPGDFLDWQAASTSFDRLTAFTQATVSITGEGSPERLRGASVTPLLFETLGVAPVRGRSLASVESDRFVVISHGLWSRRFRSDPSAVGRAITLNNESYVVAGIAPPGFSFPKDLPLGSLRDPRPVDVWLPLALKPGDRSLAYLDVVGRLRPDRTVAHARGEMEAIASRNPTRPPPRAISQTIAVEPLHTRVVGDVRPLLYVLAGAGVFVLLIACVNVANLMLARGAERQHELSVRAALGAGRWRLARQFMTESLLLGIGGSVLGLLAAVWGVALVAIFVPPGATPRLSEVDIDVSVLAFAFVLALVAPVVFGVLPAVLTSRPSAADALKDTAPSVTPASRLRQFLVAAEIALAFVLIVGAGLLIESFARLSRVSPGFDADRVLTVSVTLPEATYRTTTEMAGFADDVMARMRTVPGATHVGVVNWLPISGNRLSGDLRIEGAPFPERMDLTKTAAGGDYFSAMGIPIVRGRGFDARDLENMPGVAIVTEGFARRVWGTADPIGRQLTLGFGRPEDQPWVTVVGVAGDIKQTALSAETTPVLYFPPSQAPRPFLLTSLTFVVKTSVEPRGIASALASHVQRVDPNLPVDRVITMRNLLADSVSTPRFRGMIFASFAIAALALVATGIVGVLAFTVARRTREIGLRIALGAERSHVLKLVVRQALAMTAAGLVVGALGAIALTRLLDSYLYDVTASDPGVYVAAALVLLALAVGAAYVPARRAANLDPLRALRTE